MANAEYIDPRGTRRRLQPRPPPRTGAPIRGLLLSATFVLCFFVWSFNFDLIKLPELEPLTRWGALALAALALVTVIARPARWTPWVPAIFIVALALSIPSSVDRLRSIIELSRVILIVCLALAAARLPIRASTLALRLVFLTSMVMTVGSAGLAAIHYAAAFADGRLIGATWHPGVLGIVAVISYAGLIANAIPIKNAVYRWPLAIVILLCTAYALWVSDSRTGLLAALTMTAAAAIRFAGRLIWPQGFQLSLLQRRTIGSVLGLAVVVVFTLPLWIGVHQRDYSPDVGGNPGRGKSVSERVKIWNQAADAYSANPRTGVGFGAGGPLTERWSARFQGRHTAELPYYHSLLANSAATAGTPGIMGAILVLLDATFLILAGFLAPTPRQGFAASLGASIGLIGVLHFALLEGALQGIYCSYVFWQLAYAVNSDSRPRSRSREGAPRRTWRRNAPRYRAQDAAVGAINTGPAE